MSYFCLDYTSVSTSGHDFNGVMEIIRWDERKNKGELALACRTRLAYVYSVISHVPPQIIIGATYSCTGNECLDVLDFILKQSQQL